MYKVILFDFDGTIADSFENALEIAQEFAAEYNLHSLTRNDVENLRKENVRTLLKILKIPFHKIPFFALEMKKQQQKSISKIQPFTELVPVLGKLHGKGYKLGILTSNGEENVRGFLSKNNLEVFDFLYADIGIFGKTNAIKKFLKENSFEKDEVIYVGDEIRDIEACKKVGIKIVSVTWGYNSKEGLVKYNPDYLVNKPEELLSVIY